MQAGPLQGEREPVALPLGCGAPRAALPALQGFGAHSPTLRGLQAEDGSWAAGSGLREAHVAAQRAGGRGAPHCGARGQLREREFPSAGSGRFESRFVIKIAGSLPQQTHTEALDGFQVNPLYSSCILRDCPCFSQRGDTNNP